MGSAGWTLCGIKHGNVFIRSFLRFRLQLQVQEHRHPCPLQQLLRPVASVVPVELPGAGVPSGFTHPPMHETTNASDNAPANHFPCNNFISYLPLRGFLKVASHQISPVPGPQFTPTSGEWVSYREAPTCAPLIIKEDGRALQGLRLLQR